MALCSLGSFNGTAQKNINLVDTFKTEKKQNGITNFSIKKIAIEAPPDSCLSINGIEIIMPSTGIIEFGMNYIEINSLVFAEETEVNIIYFY